MEVPIKKFGPLLQISVQACEQISELHLPKYVYKLFFLLHFFFIVTPLDYSAFSFKEPIVDDPNKTI